MNRIAHFSLKPIFRHVFEYFGKNLLKQKGHNVDNDDEEKGPKLYDEVCCVVACLKKAIIEWLCLCKVEYLLKDVLKVYDVKIRELHYRHQYSLSIYWHFYTEEDCQNNHL